MRPCKYRISKTADWAAADLRNGNLATPLLVILILNLCLICVNPRRLFRDHIMAKKDQRIDAYIERSAPFAKPILKHLRAAVHAGCPEVVETIKWSMPHFDYKGIMCGMAAFKKHCAFGFWKSKLILPSEIVANKDAMGHFGCIRSIDDLPSKAR